MPAAERAPAPICIVSCTGNTTAADKAELLEAGADRVWSKPFPDFTDGTMQRELVELLCPPNSQRG